MTTLSILGKEYNITNFPTKLQTALQQFASKDLLEYSFDEYQQLCDEVIEVAYSCLEWDESEDEIISPDYSQLVSLMLEGQPILEL